MSLDGGSRVHLFLSNLAEDKGDATEKSLCGSMTLRIGVVMLFAQSSLVPYGLGMYLALSSGYISMVHVSLKSNGLNILQLIYYMYKLMAIVLAASIPNSFHW